MERISIRKSCHVVLKIMFGSYGSKRKFFLVLYVARYRSSFASIYRAPVGARIDGRQCKIQTTIAMSNNEELV